MAFRKDPTYVLKARNGYQLQRGVPKDVKPIIGKALWIEPGGATCREVSTTSQGFIARTDRGIAVVRGQLVHRSEALIDALPEAYDLNDPEIVALLEEGPDVAVQERWMNAEPRRHLTAAELIQNYKIHRLLMP